MKLLPVMSALRHALLSTWKFLPVAFYISWPWLLVLVPLQIAAMFYIRAYIPPIDAANPDPDAVMQLLSVRIPFAVFSILAISSIAVSWHRFILMDEVAVGWARLKIDAKVLAYFGNTILVMLLFSLLVTLLLVLMLSLPLAGGVGALFTLPVFAALLVLMFRFNVKLPAVALGNNQFNFGDALAATRGNTVPIFILVSLAFAIAAGAGLISILALRPLEYLEGLLPWILTAVALSLVNWVVSIFFITLLTTMYGYFVEGRDLS